MYVMRAYCVSELFYRNKENGHAPLFSWILHSIWGGGETISKYIICLLVMGGMKYTGHWEEQVGRWGKMRRSVLDAFSVKCLCDNQVEIKSRS